MANDEPSSAAESSGAPGTDAVRNGIKLISEYAVFPGTSLLLDGKIGLGALHTAAAFVGKAVLGPPGWILAAANSYSKSVTNKNLHEHIVKRKQPREGAQV